MSQLHEEVAVLASSVTRMAQEFEAATIELRRTNDSLNSLATEFRVVRERVDRITGEVWTGDNSSRIRTLELHVKGLYALFGFLAITLAGRLAPAFFQYLTNGS